MKFVLREHSRDIVRVVFIFIDGEDTKPICRARDCTQGHMLIPRLGLLYFWCFSCVLENL
jgi:hypothetical protein